MERERTMSSDGLRVAFLITRSGDLGGAQIHVRDLSTALMRQGHDVIVMAGEDGVLFEELRDRGVSVRPLRRLVRPIRPVDDFRTLLELRDVLREVNPDVLSTHSSKAGILGRIAGRWAGVPTLHTAHGWWFTEGRPPVQRAVYRIIEAAAAPLAARIIAVSDWDRQLAIEAGVGRPERLVTVHNAMPDLPDRFRADPAASPPRLVMIARFARQKDHPTLFRALSNLMDLEWHLDLIGEGELREEVEELAVSVGIRSRVSFLGFRKDVPELLSRAQICLLITNWEGFPRSILEGMRAGLPTVATDAGGVSEAVVDGLTGFVVSREDVEALGDRLRRLITEPELRLRMGLAGRARYEERFTFDDLVRKTLAVYEEVLATRGNGTRRVGMAMW